MYLVRGSEEYGGYEEVKAGKVGDGREAKNGEPRPT
jgi:hypothetical protein